MEKKVVRVEDLKGKYNNPKVSLEVIAEELLAAQKIYLFPHYVPDGDCIGSSAAICKAMRRMGKECIIVLEDHYPDNIAYLDKGYCVWVKPDEEMEVPDLCVAMDCSDLDRWPKRLYQFDLGKRSICIDHHVTQGCYAKQNYVDPTASSTCEIVYRLLKDVLKVEIDVEQATALYTGIALDTGSFQLINCSKRTLEVVAELYDLGIDAVEINKTLHQNERLEKIRLHSMSLNEMEMFCGGKAAITYCTLEMLEKTGADLTETDGINQTMKDIRGVEIAVFLREAGPEEIKVGFRTKDYMDAFKIAEQFKGGGRMRAAGCTLYVPLMEAKKIIMEAVEKAVAEYPEAV